MKTKSRQRLTFAQRLLFLAVAFVPFQQAMTLDVGFPLKLSEVLVIAAIGFLMLGARAPKYPATSKKLMLGLAGMVVLSTLMNIARQLPFTSFKGYDRGFTFDILQYTGYGLLVIAAGWILATRLGALEIARAVSVAIRLAALYSAAQVVLYLAGSEILATFNGATQLGRSYGELLPRNGPFLEGNYLAFFAGAGIFIAARRKDKVGVVLAAGCLVYSQSTIGIIGVVVALLALVILSPTKAVWSVLSAGVIAVMLTFLFVPQAQSFINVQSAKLGVSEDSSLSYVDASLDNRSMSAEVGFKMGILNPVAGVGSGRYGVQFQEYADPEDVPLGVIRGDVRPIANNTYAQMAAEMGLIGAGIFVVLLIGSFRRAKRAGPGLLGLVIFAAVCLTATPAWTVLPIWIVVAYLIAGRNPVAAKKTAAPVNASIEV